MSGAGYFISFEGIDRSGKSTQASLLAEALGSGAVLVREPGGTPLGEKVRSIVKDPAIEISPRAEALLFATARAELVDAVIAPALKEGRIVISDRYNDSSLAYQGFARRLGVNAVGQINEWGTAGLEPDLTILISIDPRNVGDRGSQHDRFEEEGLALQLEVADAYNELASSFPDRFVVIDGDREIAAVAADVNSIVHARIAARDAA